MTTGGLVGGLVGGVVGFFIGGPMGAVYGAGLGLGLGMMVDPMTPDAPTIGTPVPDTAVMSSEVGIPCPEVSGTGKIVGHLICYGAERTEAIYATPESSGGKGGLPEPEPQVTGYKYYMSWVLGFCAGEVDTLYTIYKNDNDKLWSGTLDKPATGGKETIVVKGLGSVEFYFGTADQVANTKVGKLLDDDTLNTPYRNYCWALFDDCYIGSYPRTPTISIVIKKIPAASFSTLDTIQTYDSNPAHALYFALNKLAGLPASWLDATSFSTIATALRLEERGISCVFKDQQSAMSYIQSMLNHIDCVLRYGSDGKFHPKLIRDDYTISALPVIDEDSILDDPSFVRASWIDTLNEVKVQYSKIKADRGIDYLGAIWTTGYNSGGVLTEDLALGMYYTWQDITASVQGQKEWLDIQMSNHALGIDKNFKLWSWGYGRYGETGQSGPGSGWIYDMEVPDGFADKTVAKIRNNPQASTVVTTGGEVWTCGWNTKYNLGVYPVNDAEVENFTKCAGTFDDACVNREFGMGIQNGFLYAVGGVAAAAYCGFDGVPRDTRYWTIVPYNNPGGFTSIWTDNRMGTWATKGLPGTIYFCGYNSYGWAGFGNNSSVFRLTAIPGTWAKFAVCANGSQFIGMKSDGTLWGCGFNSDNVLGIGSATSYTYTQTYLPNSDQGGVWKAFGFLGTGAFMALAENGKLWGCGYNDSTNQGWGVGGGNTSLEYLTELNLTDEWIGLRVGIEAAYGLKLQ